MTKAPGAPSLGLLATEAPRAALDLAALLATWPVLTTAPRGDGHPVLVLPGLLTGDPATVLLRNVLRLLGHRSAGGASARTGPYRRVVGALRDRLDRLHQESGRRVSLVGWSLGGLTRRSWRGPRQAACEPWSPWAARWPGAAAGPATCPRWSTGPRTCPARRGCCPGPGRSAARSGCPRPRSTPAPTASSPGRPAGSSRARAARTSSAGEPPRARPQPGRAVAAF